MSQYTKYPTNIGPPGPPGSVTSVDLAAPASILTVSGNPITGAGTLTLSLTTQAANTVWSGPTTGAAANPTFRALVSDDIPSLLATKTSDFQSAVSSNTDVAANTAARHVAVTLGTANGLSLSTQALSLALSSTSTVGALSSADWNTFNGKQASGSYITALTSDVTASGPGSAAATIAANAVTNAKAAQMATNTIKGNNTGGTANASDLTVSQVAAMLASQSGSSFITSGTTFTTAATISANTLFKFTLVGGGGGGGGKNQSNNKGSGGGGGGTGYLFITGLAASTGYTIAIGAGGAGGISTTTAATAGGNTTISINATTYSANGGAGAPGVTNNTNGGAGGTATNNTINVSGANGGPQDSQNADTNSGSGGSSLLGLGGSPINPAGTGNAGTGYGGGGGGGSGAAATGGAGSPGAIIVQWGL